MLLEVLQKIRNLDQWDIHCVTIENGVLRPTGIGFPTVVRHYSCDQLNESFIFKGDYQLPWTGDTVLNIKVDSGSLSLRLAWNSEVMFSSDESGTIEFEGVGMPLIGLSDNVYLRPSLPESAIITVVYGFLPTTDRNLIAVSDYDLSLQGKPFQRRKSTFVSVENL